MRLKNTHFMSTGIKAALLATMCFSPFTFASDAKTDEQFEVGKETVSYTHLTLPTMEWV